MILKGIDACISLILLYNTKVKFTKENKFTGTGGIFYVFLCVTTQVLGLFSVWSLYF
jgi:hypothetical protein